MGAGGSRAPPPTAAARLRSPLLTKASCLRLRSRGIKPRSRIPAPLVRDSGGAVRSFRDLPPKGRSRAQLNVSRWAREEAEATWISSEIRPREKHSDAPPARRHDISMPTHRCQHVGADPSFKRTRSLRRRRADASTSTQARASSPDGTKAKGPRGTRGAGAPPKHGRGSPRRRIQDRPPRADRLQAW